MRTVPATSPATALPRWRQFLRLLSNHTTLPTLPTRSLAQVRSEPLSELWFTAAFPAKLQYAAKNPDSDIAADEPILQSIEDALPHTGGPGSNKDHKSPDERTIKLGKTLRRLSPLLPNILTTQLPQDLLSPSISLHLFPSTHPHLPVVKGRIPYKAALWTAPVAWGCVPYVGNVKLEILSEKIVRSGFITAPTVEEETSHLGEEKLVVKWRTEKKMNADGSSTTSTSSGSSPTSSSTTSINRGLSTLLGGDRPLFSKDSTSGNDAFSGLFIFSFDSEGRIANHTIEHADEASGFDKTSKMVTLTDWLLGKAKWRGLQEPVLPVPGLAYRMRVVREDIRRDRETGWRDGSNS